MSMLVYPDKSNTEWISWKKITRKSGGVENFHFRWTSERFCSITSNLPSLSISPLHISHTKKPFKSVRDSYPNTFNATLSVQLPPFTGSIKARNTAAFINRPRQCKDFSKTFHNASSEMIGRNVFLKKKNKSKQRIQKKFKKNLRLFPKNKQKLEGIIGKRMFIDSFCDNYEG